MKGVIVFAALLAVLGGAAIFVLLYTKTAQKMFTKKRDKEINK